MVGGEAGFAGQRDHEESEPRRRRLPGVRSGIHSRKDASTKDAPPRTRGSMTRLSALRSNLDLMPSPLADRPGLLVRDPFRYAEGTLVIPTPLVPCLAFFN